MRRPTVFAGVTAWNSAVFLRHSLGALVTTAGGELARVVVWDNGSEDDSVRLSRDAGATVVIQRRSQADALNGLLAMAREDFVLLLHADVILLARGWLDRCLERLGQTGAALLSPEDVGCGPYTRPFGLGMPESSFLFFDRAKIEKVRRLRWRRWKRVPLPRRELDLYGPHVTHHLPRRLADRGLSWTAMDVQPSDRLPEARYGPYPEATVWTEELAFLRYGLGNFYSIEGVVTHYHNWYERVSKENTVALPSPSGRGFPLEYIRDYTRAFLGDYEAGRLVVPEAKKRDREPVAL
jgi:hypothetical protein